MAAKRGSRSSARTASKSARSKSARSKSARSKSARSKSTRPKSARPKSRRKSAAKSARKRQPGVVARVTQRVGRTARKVLFGGLGVAGYVGGVTRGRRKGRSGADGAGAGSVVKPIPDGYRTVTPYLVVRDVPRLIEFVQQAFGATELMRHLRPDGSVMHAEVEIGDSRVMIGEAPPSSPPMPGCLHLYVVDTDALYHLALQAGATSLREPTNQFYGDRMAGVQDPVGNQWWIATHVEDVSPVEIALRAAMAAPPPAPSGI